ncbi:MAG TPA: dienelactone hydrolase family protein, partial [Longimicrobium sp.]|nr:dienelactone hydrolase family protein [Longimicrobium sp.]
MTAFTHTREVRIPAGGAQLDGTLSIPPGARGVVLFAHGSGSSRFSPRNRYVAGELHAAGFATLLLDLLTPAEEQVDEVTRRYRFDIPLLAARLVHAVDWLRDAPETRYLPIGCFGASTGAAAALIAAAERPVEVRAVVSRGGRPDLAGAALERVRAPTLLVVGGQDGAVITMNNEALLHMVNARARLRIVPGATHLFQEPGALEQVAAMACEWFRAKLVSTPDVEGPSVTQSEEKPMASEAMPPAYLPDAECGVPGGGRGRRDEAGGSGVYPASAGGAPLVVGDGRSRAGARGNRGGASGRHGDQAQSRDQ